MTLDGIPILPTHIHLYWLRALRHALHRIPRLRFWPHNPTFRGAMIRALHCLLCPAKIKNFPLTVSELFARSLEPLLGSKFLRCNLVHSSLLLRQTPRKEGHANSIDVCWKPGTGERS